MIVECLMCLAVEKHDFNQPTKTQQIVQEMFSKHYEKKTPTFTHKRILINVDERTDFVITTRRNRFFKVVYYFSI